MVDFWEDDGFEDPYDEGANWNDVFEYAEDGFYNAEIDIGGDWVTSPCCHIFEGTYFDENEAGELELQVEVELRKDNIISADVGIKGYVDLSQQAQLFFETGRGQADFASLMSGYPKPHVFSLEGDTVEIKPLRQAFYLESPDDSEVITELIDSVAEFFNRLADLVPEEWDADEDDE